jgi:hypothetical protein
LPALVVDVNLSEQTVSAQPTIQASVADIDGNITSVNLPILIHVPIVFPRAGGFALTFPISSGDEILVVFASRCIDAWWQSSGIQVQAEFRMHDLSDGFALLAPTSKPKALENVSSNNVQLRNSSGLTVIEITPSGQVNITASTINLNGATNITGGLSINGSSYTAHQHSGVTSGGANTGGVV